MLKFFVFKYSYINQYIIKYCYKDEEGEDGFYDDIFGQGVGFFRILVGVYWFFCGVVFV